MKKKVKSILTTLVIICALAFLVKEGVINPTAVKRLVVKGWNYVYPFAKKNARKYAPVIREEARKAARKYAPVVKEKARQEIRNRI